MPVGRMERSHPAMTWQDFPGFYSHPVIRELAMKPKWTVSDKNKMPIDMYELEYNQRIFGARAPEQPSLVDLNRLCQVIPNAANHAFYLDSNQDGYCVLDIEPTCPVKLRDDLLRMAYLYGEFSLSGKGLHLIFKLPDCIKNYPAAMTKTVMKEEHGYYEVLLAHYVTFTRNQLPVQPGSQAFEPLFEALCAVQTDTTRNEVDISDLEPGDIPDFKILTEKLQTCKYRKTPDDFHGDLSRYEYGHISWLYYRLMALYDTALIQKNGHEYDPNESAWILYETIMPRLEHRDKHDKYRDGLPWVLYLCREVIAKTDAKNGEK